MILTFDIDVFEKIRLMFNQEFNQGIQEFSYLSSAKDPLHVNVISHSGEGIRHTCD